MAELETWELWYPGGAATGLPFARARIAPAELVLVHAAPEVLAVEVRDASGRRIAHAAELRREGDYVPMTRIRRRGAELVREDAWPGADDLGSVVLLAGGEAGILRAWEEDQHERWRWSVEFFHDTTAGAGFALRG